MFEMTVEIALEFYQRCKDRKAKTEKQRLKIMMELAKEGKLKSVMQTKRTPDQVAKDYAKNFGQVLYIKSQKEKPDGHS
jgi:hypothetical protein